MKDIKAAIFDMDGTIVDSNEMWNTIAVRYVESMGLVPNDGLNEAVNTMTLRDASQFIKDEYNLQVSVDDIVNRVGEISHNYYLNESKPKKNVSALLESLKKDNVKLVVATLTEYNSAVVALKHTGLYDFFDDIITCSMVGADKHSPDVFIKAAYNVGVDIAHSVVYEDSVIAVLTAKKAGFKVVGVYDTYTSDESWSIICDTADEVINLNL